MPDIINPVYPRTGEAIVDPNSWFQIQVIGENAITPADIDVYLSLGPQVDITYPVSPDYYGTSIQKNFLVSLATLEDPVGSGYHRLAYWTGAAFAFESPAATRSQITQVTPSELLLDIRFDQPQGYQTENLIRVRTPNNEQVLQYNIKGRDFYSPAIGDAQSTFEAGIHSLDFSAALPVTWKLRKAALAAFDIRDSILAARRIAVMSLQRQLGFPDLALPAQQITQGFRTLVFDNVSQPRSIKDIDLALGDVGITLIKSSIAELGAKKGIPREWLGPVASAADFVRIDITYRVRCAAQLIAIAVRAVQEGLV